VFDVITRTFSRSTGDEDYHQVTDLREESGESPAVR
jgi:hypothetical protein